MKDKNNEIVGKCKHCGDPIYRFQVEAHRGCVREFEFNPDYLDFQKGVEITKELYKNYVKLADDQRLPLIITKYPNCTIALEIKIRRSERKLMSKASWRKVELG